MAQALWSTALAFESCSTIYCLRDVTLGKILNLDFFINKTVTVEWKRNNEYVKHFPQMPNVQVAAQEIIALLVKATVTMNESFLLDTDVLGRYFNSIRY